MGTIHKLIDPKFQARHDGLSKWAGRYHVNEFSIGICLQNNGIGPYTIKQYISLAWLVNILERRYPDITKSRIVGHATNCNSKR